MADTTTNPNPYVGPRPFERNDSRRFFGRDQEANELLSLIVANRITVIYAPSGAGKTSLLNAQVAGMLEEEGFEVWPFARLRGPVIESINPDDIYNIYTFYTLLSWAGEDADPAELSAQTITSYLEAHPLIEDEFGYAKPRLLIFDQFEEIFTAYPARWFEREGFFNHISRALEEDPLLRVVFSLREDYVAQLDPFAHLLPKNLRNRFRLERMRPAASLEAIRGPLNETSRDFAPGVAEKLVEDLRQVRVETITGETETVEGEYIEPVQLQVVCQNLWEDLPDDITVITDEHLQQFGNINQALAAFYTRAVERAQPHAGLKEEDVRDWFEKSLITPAGTRGTVYRGALQTGSMNNAAIDVLENMHIIRGEWRAGARWYELTHDRLIEPIEKSNRQWLEERQAARIRRIKNAALAIGALFGASVLCWFTSIFIINLLFESPLEDSNAEVRETVIAQSEMIIQFTAEADVRATEDKNATATAVMRATADEQATATAVMRATEDNNATATTIARDAQDATATAEFIAINEAIEATAAAQATLDVYATSTAYARATADAVATRTAEDLGRILQPIRPLQPGTSIGAAGSSSVGTLSAFVQDSTGNYFILGPRDVLSLADTIILQPAPVDGGKEENSIARSLPRLGPDSSLITGAVLEATELIELAQLSADVEFSSLIPNVGPVLDTASPQVGTAVTVIGRTSGVVYTTLEACPSGSCTYLTRGPSYAAPYTLADTLSPGDEGALVVNEDNLAVGIVAQINTVDGPLVVPIEAILRQNNVQFVNSNAPRATIETGLFERGVDFSPDGNLLAAAGRTVRVWEPSSQYTEPILEISIANRPIVVRFSPNSEYLLTGDDFGNIYLNHIDSDEEQTAVQGHKDLIEGIEFITEDVFVSISYDEQVRFWEVDEAFNINLLHDFATNHRYVRSVAVSPNKNYMVTGHQDGSMILWNISDLNNPTQEKTIKGHSIDVLALDFSPDSSTVASADSIGEVHLRSVATFEDAPYFFWRATRNIIWDLAYSPDGETIVTVGRDQQVVFWDADDPQNRSWVYQGHTDEIRDLDFNPTGQWLATASGDRTLRIWRNPFYIEPPAAE